MAGHQRMIKRSVTSLSGVGGLQRAGGPWDHRQHGAGRAGATDIEDRPYLFDAGDLTERRHHPPQRGERVGRKQVAGRRTRPHDAVAIRGTEAGGDFVDEREIIVGDGRTPQQRPQVVIDPQPGEPDDGEDRQEEGGAGGKPAPSWAAGGFVTRWSSAGSTIQPRQFAAPQWQGMAASAGQQ